MNGAVIMTQEKPKQQWTTSELAEYANVDPSYIRQLLLSGKLKGNKLGPIWVIPNDEVQRWLKSRQK